MTESSELSLKAESIFHLGPPVGGFPVTNTLIVSSIVVLLYLVGTFLMKRKFELVPKGFQNLFEFVIEEALAIMDSIIGSRALSEKYLPLIATIFLFIVSSNWLGLLPGVGSFVVHHGNETIPLLRSPASDLNFTLALALIAVFVTNILGFTVAGFLRYGSKYLNFKNPIFFFVGILEIISEIAKIASLSLRLFGNVFAGEVLLVSIGVILPFILPLPFLMLEMLVGIIQAFVFSMLTLVFLATAIHHESHEGGH